MWRSQNKGIFFPLIANAVKHVPSTVSLLWFTPPTMLLYQGRDAQETPLRVWKKI